MTMATSFADLNIDIPAGRSGEIDTTCPQCSHLRKKSRDKCLSVNAETGTYHCHHCGWSGKVGDTNGYGAPLPKITYTAPAPPRESVLPQGVLDWFAARGIPDWVLADAGITAGREFSPNQGKEVLAIRFPYTRDGSLVNIKYRAYPKDFWMAKGAERILYGLDDLAGAETICIVEGEMDKLSVDAVQAYPTVSVPDGAPALDASNYGSKFAFLTGIAEERITAAKHVILATDADAPGKKLADELARRIGYHKCQRVTWPEGCKDANEALVKLGSKALLDALADAQPYPVAGIVTVRDLAQPIEDLYERGLDSGCTAGWMTFDRLYRARSGLFAVVTGSPGSGKSYFLDNLMVRLAQRHGWSFGICSPENQPLERHLAGILSVFTGEPFNKGQTQRMTLERMRAARSWAEGRFAFVLPDEPSIGAVIERAEVLVYRMGIRGLVVDPWNELDHSRPSNMTETEFTSQALSQLRQFARRAGVQVWLVAHPTKLQKDHDGHYPVPTPYDVSGSAHFYNKSDACISVWRDPMTDMPEVHVQKMRFSETGELGVARFRYDKPTGRFFEV
jgi:twinkle protein